MEINKADQWQFLQNYTPARIARGRAGHSLPTAELLKFQSDHAQARDAVYSEIQISSLQEAFMLNFKIEVLPLQSEVKSRSQYLQRPDLGRTISQLSRETLSKKESTEADICFVIADGLSAKAINEHSLPFLQLLLPKLQADNWKIAPICIVEQGRVAIADEIGFLLKASIVVILIGERPGLTSADSMGAYITYQPQVGLTDESRNCVSNIRPEGLNYVLATEKIFYLLNEIKGKKISGVQLKDEMANYKLL
ncbi:MULTISPECIES: ethanolamine ammonia-lyase subunit EutC [unclassified Arcicella]|uniref:ethanolamine ammonia-lyase subunit EutC n=1 Tax=unclassified Arcicella TaxID=2644986 RepID=UPI00285D8E36|nr:MULTISPECIES: ethanolamine ammonia-lyase subunit EutC [unclassified Arcicella]MDR6564129.1 ethanolamine ammonia-lyase small subunit [Arcicella sp. BE51]MDR6813882.1 ethanolamine ammonia-lyase small subunit [Arcicella sp. BE140]MDR6825194.1 ethanolamine ammonia-lyase small subunit [Arcicella sp. BE139]